MSCKERIREVQLPMSNERAESRPDPSPNTELILCLVLIAGTLLLYDPATYNDFTNYDDNFYITSNANVRSGLSWGNVLWAFTTFDVSNWHPLTWLGYLLEDHFFGLKPAGYHFVNVLLHALNAALLFWILRRGTGSMERSFWAAALFAAHPLNVESVAWVAEFKNVLSTFFGLLAIAAYGWYVRKASIWRYGLVLILFALSLMAKPMLVTLPFALLLLDYWPLNRLSSPRNDDAPGAGDSTDWSKLPRLLIEKVPLLLLSVGSSIVTLKAQQGAMSAGDSGPNITLPLFSFWNALFSYRQYVVKTFWPERLSVFYPLHAISPWQLVSALLLLIPVTWICLRARRKRYLASGWFWYLGTLVPVIGIVQVGRQAMADRYAYVPLIGLFVAVVWLLADWAQQLSLGKVWLALPVFTLSLLAVGTRQQIAYWHDSVTLFTHAIAVTSGNYLAHVSLGSALTREGRVDEALRHFYLALEENPQYGVASYDVAVQLQARGRAREALHQYEYTLTLVADPVLESHIYADMGMLHSQLREDEMAQADFRECLARDPYNFNANLGLGKILFAQGRYREAAALFMTANKVLPSDEGFFYLGKALRGQGKNEEASQAFRQALVLRPNSKEAQNELQSLTQQRK